MLAGFDVAAEYGQHKTDLSTHYTRTLRIQRKLMITSKLYGGGGGSRCENKEKRFNRQDQLAETRNRLRFLPLGFLPLGADRKVLCGARTYPRIGTLAT